MFHKSQSQQNQSIEEMEIKKVSLFAEISKLGLTLEEMDAKIANHASLTLQFGTLEKDIEDKKLELEEISRKVAELTSEAGLKEKLVGEIADLNTKKTEIEEKITYMQSVIRVLQAETENFQKGKEYVISQMQDKIDKVNYDLFAIEQKKQDAIKTLQAMLDSFK